MAGGNYDRSQKKGQLNPAVSYCFGLQVEAAFFVPVKSVRVFTKENEFDYYQEGGLNDYVHMLRKPISKPFTFQVERYVGVDAGLFDQNSGFLDPLALGTDLILPVILYVNRAQTKNAGQNFSFTNCARAYIFTGCTVTAKEYGELNAEQSKLLTETTTIAYKELFAINQINPAWERGEAWEFDTAKTNPSYLGKGESHKENRSSNKAKKDLISGADKTRWQINKSDFKGNNKRHIPSVNNPAVNDTKEEGEKKGKANLWMWDKEHPKGGPKDHTENRSKNDPKSKGETTGKEKMWQFGPDLKNPINPTPYDGNKKFHTDERGRKNDPKSKLEQEGKANLWLWDKQHPKGGPKDHTENRSKNDPKSKLEQEGKENLWLWDKDHPTGGPKDHTENRSNNTKPTPVKWPPTRRALMAQALSDNK